MSISWSTNGRLGSRAAVRLLLPGARDAALALSGFWLALFLRFDGEVPGSAARRFAWLSLAVVALLLVAAAARGLYRSMPEYTSVGDLVRLAQAVGLSSLCLFLLALFGVAGGGLVPRSVPIIAAPIVLFALGGARIFPRLTAHFRAPRPSGRDAERLLIVGAGDAGEMVVRDMLRNPGSKFVPVGFLDDDQRKRRRRIHGVEVLGSTSDVEDAVLRTGASSVLIAMPSASSRVVRSVLRHVATAGAKAKIVQSLRDLVGVPVTAADIRDVDVADLIGREPTKIRTEEIAGYLEGKCVLITGAAGSIGSELARQVIRFKPATLLLLDNNESDLYCLAEELERHGRAGAGRVEAVIADIRDRVRIEQVFGAARPHVVFHAAAYKHVPVMEKYPAEAIITNVIGTRHVAEAAVVCGTERFVLISTDKAVNPTSVLGSTKRVAEMMIGLLNDRSSTAFGCVRFGNVFGSRGSVVPVFMKQIREGGPVTVTHPAVARYFMTPEEATALIIQAGALVDGGETYVLDMGEPVRILDLAERMRDLLTDGHREKIGIVFTGLRPGEKLHERMWDADEVLFPSSHPRILRVEATPRWTESAQLEQAVDMLQELAAGHLDPDLIREHLFDLVSSGSPAWLRAREHTGS